MSVVTRWILVGLVVVTSIGIGVGSGANEPTPQLLFNGNTREFMPSDWGGVQWVFAGTEFDGSVWDRLIRIPDGHTTMVPVGSTNHWQNFPARRFGDWQITHSTWGLCWSVEIDPSGEYLGEVLAEFDHQSSNNWCGWLDGDTLAVVSGNDVSQTAPLQIELHRADDQVETLDPPRPEISGWAWRHGWLGDQLAFHKIVLPQDAQSNRASLEAEFAALEEMDPRQALERLTEVEWPNQAWAWVGSGWELLFESTTPIDLAAGPHGHLGVLEYATERFHIYWPGRTGAVNVTLPFQTFAVMAHDGYWVALGESEWVVIAESGVGVSEPQKYPDFSDISPDFDSYYLRDVVPSAEGGTLFAVAANSETMESGGVYSLDVAFPEPILHHVYLPIGGKNW